MDYLTINKTAWNKRTDTHIASKFYDVDGFLSGQCALKEIETNELKVKGKTLLHLQCHFGLDTLSWARKGAEVTGIDLSSTAIDKAQELTKQAGLNAEFICTDVYGTPEVVSKQFDIVFTSYGALCWLPDLDLWAQVVSDCLKAGGQFYMVEFHPLEALFEGYSYFYQTEPDVDEEGTYTENCSGEKNTLVTWPHSISDIINALLKVGLKLEHYNEFGFSPYNCFDGLTEEVHTQSCGDKTVRYVMEHKQQRVPLTYSISAVKG